MSNATNKYTMLIKKSSDLIWLINKNNGSFINYLGCKIVKNRVYSNYNSNNLVNKLIVYRTYNFNYLGSK